MRIMPHDWVGYVMLVVYSVALIYVAFQIFFLRRDFSSQPEFHVIYEPKVDFSTSFSSTQAEKAFNELQKHLDRVFSPKKQGDKTMTDGKLMFPRAHLIDMIIGALQDGGHSNPASTRTRAADLLDEIENFQKEVKAATIEPKEESNLVAHARREMEIIGEDDWTKEGILKCVQAFSDMGHSGGSAMVVIPMLKELLSYRPLSLLTDNPEEWNHIGEDVWGRSGGVWQNLRDSSAFSDDGGKTYYYLRENEPITHLHTMHDSKKMSGG